MQSLTKPMEVHRPSPTHPLTAQQRTENRLRGMTPMQRADAILNDRDTAQEIVGNADLAEIGGQRAIDRAAADVASAGPQDFARQQTDSLGSFAAGIQQRADYEQQVRNDRAQRLHAFDARKSERAEAFIKEMLDKEKSSAISASGEL